MSKQCPVTHQHCHDPLCEGDICLRDCHPRDEETDVLWNRHIISKQLRIIDRLTRSHEPPPKPAKALTSISYIITPSGDISVINSNLNNMAAQTTTVLFGQNNVPAQLVPVAADLVTVEPISTINAGSEVYTSSDPTIATVAAVPGGAEGQYLVTRVPNAVGTVVITYTAVNTAGTTITNSGGVGDTYIFQGQPTGVAAALTSTIGAPTA